MLRYANACCQMTQVQGEDVEDGEATEQRIEYRPARREVGNVRGKALQVVLGGQCSGELSCQDRRMRLQDVLVDGGGNIDALGRCPDKAVAVSVPMVHYHGSMLTTVLCECAEPDNLLPTFPSAANPLPLGDGRPSIRDVGGRCQFQPGMWQLTKHLIDHWQGRVRNAICVVRFAADRRSGSMCQAANGPKSTLAASMTAIGHGLSPSRWQFSAASSA